MSFKTLIANMLRRFGYQLYRIEDVRPFAHDLKTCLKSPILQRLSLSTIIDVGGFRWPLVARGPPLLSKKPIPPRRGQSRA